MAEEKWWTGDEAVENGFCDELMFEESSTVIENASRIVVNAVPIDISQFRTVPKALLNSPNHTGGITNKKPEEKEEKQMEPKNTNPAITTEDALKAAYPDLVANPDDKKKLSADIASIKGLLAAGVEQGELKADTPVDLLSHTLIDVLYGEMLCWDMSGGAYSFAARTQEFCDTFLLAMIKPYLNEKGA